MQVSPSLDVIRFGPFHLDLKTGELHRGEHKVRLQEQPFQILKMLLEHPGGVVSREEIRKTLWSDDTIVEFENSVHAAIKKLRTALSDSAENPVYIETLPRKGYRFIGKLKISEPEQTESAPLGGPSAPQPNDHFVDLKRDGLAAVEPRQIEEPRKKHLLGWLLATASILVFAAGTLYWIGRRGESETASAPLVLPFTSYSGFEGEPSFSPDGNQIAFVWGNKMNIGHIYIKQIGTDSPRPLTSDPNTDFSPAYSPDGHSIAFVRNLGPGKSAVMIIPANGGNPRQVAELPTQKAPERSRWLCWHPDGRWLAVASDQDVADAPAAIYLLSPETGQRRRLTYPPWGFGADARMGGDTNPVFSPDGRALIFVRFRRPETSEIFLVPLTKELVPEGEPRQLTFGNQWILTPAWVPGTQDIIYSAGTRIHSARLWRISTSGSGKPMPLPFSGQGTAFDPAISLGGRRLVYRDWFLDINIWRNRIVDRDEEPMLSTRLMGSTKVQDLVQYSPDGKAILYVTFASGSAEIWVCDENGANPFQLTHLEGPMPGTPRWSPSGREIVLYLSSNGQSDLWVVPARGGPISQLTSTAFDEEHPSYSWDGQWIYFSSNRGGNSQVWKMPAVGGDAVQLTRNGGTRPQESIERKALFYLKPRNRDYAELWMIPVDGGEETRVLGQVFRTNFDVTQRGIYYAYCAGEPKGNETQFLFYGFASRKSKILATTARPVVWGFTVSPDEKWILSTEVGDSGGSDLVLVENFR